MFASPVAPPRVLPSRDVFPFLRLITSPACRGDKLVPLSAIADLTDLSRFTLYRARCSGWVGEDMAELLTSIIRRFEAGELRFRRTSPHSDEANR
jgi:hypothetical protein